MGEGAAVLTKRRQQELTEWSEKVRACQESGKTARKWCTENGITPKTYYEWKKKVDEYHAAQQTPEAEKAEEEKQGRFVELPARQERESAQPVSGELIASIQQGETRVEFYSGADAGRIQAIGQMLRLCSHAE